MIPTDQNTNPYKSGNSVYGRGTIIIHWGKDKTTHHTVPEKLVNYMVKN